MSTRDKRRVLVFAIVAAVLSALAGAWLNRFWARPTPEERARKKADELREKVRDLTHGK